MIENNDWLHILLFADLDTDLGYLVAIRNTRDRDIRHREITKYPSSIIDEMSMCRIIALVVGLAIDPWESTEHSLLSHGFNIAIDGCSPDFWCLELDLIIDIIRREMSAGTSRTDDVTILMGSHIPLIM
jgi:hypothetical protein